MKMAVVSGRVRLVWQAFGARGLVRRATYLGQLRSGLLARRLPISTYGAWAGVEWPHRFDGDVIRGSYDEAGLTELAAADAVARCDDLLQGQMSFYGGPVREVGSPPRWLALPDGGAELASAHWSAGSDDLRVGDIKDVWEPSRFGFTFAFARAYVTTGDDRWAEHWWSLFEDWAVHNPPNTGPNWRCGQESSLRAIAVCFALSAFGDHPTSTQARLQLAHQFLDATRARVAPTVGYALSQRNNHAISELVFLLSLPGGVTKRWQRLLREALDDQWYADGSYAQQSLVYERLAVHALVWLLQVQRDLDVGTTDAIRARLAAARDFLARVSDPVAGRLPNSGANDGALLFDLDATERWNARPVLALLGHPSDGPALETPIWFPPERLQLRGGAVGESAFVTLRGERSLLLTHVGTGRHRAGDDDQQAIELIVDGLPVVLDPGTFRYSGRAPWRQPFTARRAHSMAVPAAAPDDQGLGRFLRESMPAAHVLHRATVGADEVLVSVRTDGPCSFTRAIIRRGDRYMVIDHVSGGDASVGWLLPGDAVVSWANRSVTLRHAHGTITTPGRFELPARSVDDPCSGWWSPHYGDVRPVTMARVPVAGGDTVWASFAPVGEALLVIADVRHLLEPAPELAAAVARLCNGAEVSA